MLMGPHQPGSSIWLCWPPPVSTISAATGCPGQWVRLQHAGCCRVTVLSSRWLDSEGHAKAFVSRLAGARVTSRGKKTSFHMQDRLFRYVFLQRFCCYRCASCWFWGSRYLCFLCCHSTYTRKGSAQCFSTLGEHAQSSGEDFLNSTDAGGPVQATESGPQGMGHEGEEFKHSPGVTIKGPGSGWLGSGLVDLEPM